MAFIALSEHFYLFMYVQYIKRYQYKNDKLNQILHTGPLNHYKSPVPTLPTMQLQP